MSKCDARIYTIAKPQRSGFLLTAGAPLCKVGRESTNRPLTLMPDKYNVQNTLSFLPVDNSLQRLCSRTFYAVQIWQYVGCSLVILQAHTRCWLRTGGWIMLVRSGGLVLKLPSVAYTWLLSISPAMAEPATETEAPSILLQRTSLICS